MASTVQRKTVVLQPLQCLYPTGVLLRIRVHFTGLMEHEVHSVEAWTEEQLEVLMGRVQTKRRLLPLGDQMGETDLLRSTSGSLACPRY